MRFVSFTTLFLLFSSQAFAQSKDIVDTAVAAGQFKTLVAAVQAAGLVDALKAPGPLTVLAPTDEAFAKLPEGTVESLLKPENKQQLIDILTYHVVPGSVDAATVSSLSSAKSLNGQQIDIENSADGLSVDDAKVTAADIRCSNGIIHIIDSVILPSTDNIPTVATNAGTFSTLLAAAQAAGLVEALAGDGPLTVFAPNDQAFGTLPAGTVASLLRPENKGKLADILKYHVVSGRVYASDALRAKSATTLQGTNVNIAATEQGASVENAAILQTDLDASNGVIHVIDRVLIPTGKPAVVASCKTMIEQAIASGAPMYNAGHHGQCAAIYMNTLEQIIARNDHGMSPQTMQHLQNTMVRARGDASMTSRSWTLRHALDMAYANAAN